MGLREIRQAFNDLTGHQYGRRNKAFEEGWHIAHHWCGTYELAKGGEMVARITKGPHGGLTIERY